MARGKSFLSRFLRRDEEPEAELEDGWGPFESDSPWIILQHDRLHQVLTAFESASQWGTLQHDWFHQLLTDGVEFHPLTYVMPAGAIGPTYVSRFTSKVGSGWELGSQRLLEYQQTQLPFQIDETEELKSRLIEMAREVKALREGNKKLRQKAEKYGDTQDKLLARIKQYHKAFEGMRIAADKDAKGLLLFSERYNGRVEEVAADSMDVVFDDNDGGTFAQSYSSNQLAGAKMPEPGDWIYAFAAVYRSPAKPVSWNEILREDSGIDDLDFPVEEAEGSIDL